MAVWYSLWSIGILFPFWYVRIKKKLATLCRRSIFSSIFCLRCRRSNRKLVSVKWFRNRWLDHRLWPNILEWRILVDFVPMPISKWLKFTLIKNSAKPMLKKIQLRKWDTILQSRYALNISIIGRRSNEITLNVFCSKKNCNFFFNTHRKGSADCDPQARNQSVKFYKLTRTYTYLVTSGYRQSRLLLHASNILISPHAIIYVL
jgi:hypothetical protein